MKDIRITAISDLHGYEPKLPGGDLLIIAGDMTARDDEKGWKDFSHWLRQQDYDRKIFIGGNHDRFLALFQPGEIPFFNDATYLCNSMTEYQGIKIWGAPHSLLFDSVNPLCTAFMKTDEELLDIYEKIPTGIDILVSHTPPHGVLDHILDGSSAGSISLAMQLHRIKPKVVICGHIHEAYGHTSWDSPTSIDFYNVSVVNRRYQLVNSPTEIRYEV